MDLPDLLFWNIGVQKALAAFKTENQFLAFEKSLPFEKEVQNPFHFIPGPKERHVFCALL